MNNRALSLLGLCRAAGKISLGYDAVVNSIKNGEARLVVFASDVSKNTRKKVLSTIDNINVRAVDFECDKNIMGASLGKLCAVACVNDAGFAKKLFWLLCKEDEEEFNLC